MRDQLRGKATGGRGRGVSQGGGGVPPPSGLMAGGAGKTTRPKQRPFLRREVVGIEILIFFVTERKIIICHAMKSMRMLTRRISIVCCPASLFFQEDGIWCFWEWDLVFSFKKMCLVGFYMFPVTKNETLPNRSVYLSHSSRPFSNMFYDC